MVRYRYGVNPVHQLRGEVDRLFGDFFGRAGSGSGEQYAARTFPALNVWQKDHELFVEAELPGVKSEDLEISVVGNELSIKGRRPDFEEANVSFHRRERGAGDFHRVLQLPVEVDGDRVQARLADGVLLITLPKAEAAKPRKIQVQAK